MISNTATLTWKRTRMSTDASLRRCATSTPTPPPSLTSAGPFSKTWTQCPTDGTGQTLSARPHQHSHPSTTTTQRATRTPKVTTTTLRTQKSPSHTSRCTQATTTTTTEEADGRKHQPSG